MKVTIPDRDDIYAAHHYRSMRGGDNALTYSQDGELVIPLAVQEQHPELVLAAIQAIGSMGGNPSQYFVGSKEGSYNPDTGVQEFAWYDDLWDWAKNGASSLKDSLSNAYDNMPTIASNIGEMATSGVDYLANSRTGQSLAAGAANAGLAKLAGASNKQALAAGIGGGLGYAAGDALSSGLDNIQFNKDNAAAISAGSIKSRDFLDDYGQKIYKSTGFLDAAGNLYDSMSGAGMTGASLAGTAAALFAGPDKKPAPNVNLQLNNPTPSLTLPTATDSGGLRQYFDSNESANITSGLSPDLPVAPLTSLASSGIKYKQKVKDKDTGEYRYVDIDNNDAASFSRALQSASRRRGFGSKILV